jgi:large subunit ribosomal protein L22
MPQWGYSIKEIEPERTVRCSGRELRISPKAATEICRSIRGMKVSEAKRFLESVIAGTRSVAYKRYKKEVPHKSLEERWHAGRFPVAAASRILALLEQLESNAEYKGLDLDKLRIIHAASQRGMKIRKFIPRAMGRSTPYFNVLTHVELVGYEGSE